MKLKLLKLILIVNNKLNLFTHKEMLPIIKRLRNKEVYNYLLIPDQCFKSSSCEVVLR
jgi:hypothetical protein